MAPEILKSTTNYSMEVDIYSFGNIISAMNSLEVELTLKEYRGDSALRAYRNIP